MLSRRGWLKKVDAQSSLTQIAITALANLAPIHMPIIVPDDAEKSTLPYLTAISAVLDGAQMSMITSAEITKCKNCCYALEALATHCQHRGLLQNLDKYASRIGQSLGQWWSICATRCNLMSPDAHDAASSHCKWRYQCAYSAR